jgi:hypothetical protein
MVLAFLPLQEIRKHKFGMTFNGTTSIPDSMKTDTVVQCVNCESYFLFLRTEGVLNMMMLNRVWCHCHCHCCHHKKNFSILQSHHVCNCWLINYFSHRICTSVYDLSLQSNFTAKFQRLVSYSIHNRKLDTYFMFPVFCCFTFSKIIILTKTFSKIY